MKSLMVLTMLMLSLNTYAQSRRGPGDGGGGDPMTQQFIVMGKQLGSYFRENPFESKLPFDAEEFAKKIIEIDDSVKDETKKDLLEFTSDILKDSDGVEKAAIFDRKNSSIRVNRNIWQNYTDEQRLTLVVMEVSGLVKGTLRYESAEILLKNRVALILSIPYSKEITKNNLSSASGWRIVDQDSDQFSRITEYDVIIDGGTVGSGTKEEERIQKFLSNPAGDKEWSAQIEKAWEMKRPAYLVVSTKDGSMAFVSSVSLGLTRDVTPKAAVVIYTMLFQKQKQIYSGACSVWGNPMSIREKLLNCYINSDNYSAQDFLEWANVKEAEAPEVLNAAMKEAFLKLRETLELVLAYDQDNVEAALRANYIYNYSDLFFGRIDYVHRLLITSLRAHGLVPSLFGPFTKSSYWVKTKQKDVAAIRMFKALQALAENDLSFMTEKFHCKKEDNSIVSGPALVDTVKLKGYRRSKQCNGFTQGTDRPAQDQLFEVMIEAGFHYEYSTQQWIKQ